MMILNYVIGEVYQAYKDGDLRIIEINRQSPHDWVVISKPDESGNYKIISKCSKCGKEIE